MPLEGCHASTSTSGHGFFSPLRNPRPDAWPDTLTVTTGGVTMIRLKRAYEPASKDDGLRILVERLWPRGVSKRRGKIDVCRKAPAPSTDLRKGLGHDQHRAPTSRKRA